MKQGWELKKLGEVCNVGYGTRVVNKRDGGSIYPVYGGGGPTFFMDTFNRADCLVVGRFALSEKCTRFVKGQFFLNDSGLTVSPLNKNELFQNFLNLQLLFLNDYIYSLAKGAAQKNLDVSAFKNIEIHYPKSLPEQERIVSILDQVFSAIEQAKANAEKNLKNAKELFDSYLNGVFTNKGADWEVKTLGDVCKYEKIPNKKPDLPYVGLEDIQSNTGIFIGSLTPKVMKSLTFYFNENHILYGRLRPYLNKILMPKFEGHCSTEIFPIQPKSQIIEKKYLFQWLKMSDTVKKINSTWTGATLPRANMNSVLEFEINLPPLKEQKFIVQKLDELSVETKQLEQIYQQKIIELENLKKSILQKSFNGEL